MPPALSIASAISLLGCGNDDGPDVRRDRLPPHAHDHRTPAMSASGLSGSLVDAIRAGMTTIAIHRFRFSCLSATYATLRRNDA